MKTEQEIRKRIQELDERMLRSTTRRRNQLNSIKETLLWALGERDYEL